MLCSSHLAWEKSLHARDMLINLSFSPQIKTHSQPDDQVKWVCPLWVFLRSGLAVPQAVARKPLPQKVSALDSGISMWRPTFLTFRRGSKYPSSSRWDTFVRLTVICWRSSPDRRGTALSFRCGSLISSERREFSSFFFHEGRRRTGCQIRDTWETKKIQRGFLQ